MPTSKSLTLLAMLCAAVASPLGAEPKKQAAKLEPVTDSSVVDARFWGEWEAGRQSPSFLKLETDAGAARQVQDAVALARSHGVQPVANVAVASVADAGRMMAAADGAEVDQRAALATVAALRTTQDQRKQAAQTAPPAQRAAMANFSASLSTGIAGLPGIYLNGNEGARGAVPSGYAPVAGGSLGCVSR